MKWPDSEIGLHAVGFFTPNARLVHPSELPQDAELEMLWSLAVECEP